MASVQELILAAQSKQKKRPLSVVADLINSAAGGYSEGVELAKTRSQTDLNRAEIARKLIEADQTRQEMEAQAKLRQQFEEKLALNSEQTVREQMMDVGPRKKGVTPAQKFSEEWRQDEKGNVTRTIKEVTTKTPNSIEEALIDKYNRGEMSIEEVIAKKGSPVLDRSMRTALTKAKVELADNRPMVESITKEIDRVQELNKTSYGGYFGGLKMKFKSAIDADPEKNPEFKNTADVVNTMQGQVSKVLKSTFGGQLSDGERAYLNQVYGALPNMSRAERDIAMTNVKTMLFSRLAASQSKFNELSSYAGIEPEKGSDGETPEARKARLLKELQEAK